MYNKIFSLLICLIFLSCSSEDTLIDRYVDETSYILSTDENKLERLSAENAISEIKFANEKLGRITKIKKFRGKFYLISPENKKIFVLDNATNQIVTVDYSMLDLMPSDICFPNATDGYVAHSNNSCVTILDLTNNKISGLQIATVGSGTNISGFGNQIHLVHPAENSVSIIDTRTNKVEKVVTVTGQPNFLEFFDDGTKSVVVSTGNGKTENSSQEKTAAEITIIDAINGEVETTFALGKNEDAKNLLPTSIAISPKFIYVSSTKLTESSNSSTVWRISTSNNYQAKTAMLKSNSAFIGYNKVSNQMYLIENDVPQLVIFDGNSHSKIKTLKLNKIPTAIIFE